MDYTQIVKGPWGGGFEFEGLLCGIEHLIERPRGIALHRLVVVMFCLSLAPGLCVRGGKGRKKQDCPSHNPQRAILEQHVHATDFNNSLEIRQGFLRTWRRERRAVGLRNMENLKALKQEQLTFCL